MLNSFMQKGKKTQSKQNMRKYTITMQLWNMNEILYVVEKKMSEKIRFTLAWSALWNVFRTKQPHWI